MATRRYHPWFGVGPTPPASDHAPARVAPRRPVLPPARGLARFGHGVFVPVPNVVVPREWAPKRPVRPPARGWSRSRRGDLYVPVVVPRPTHAEILSATPTVEARGMIVTPL